MADFNSPLVKVGTHNQPITKHNNHNQRVPTAWPSDMLLMGVIEGDEGVDEGEDERDDDPCDG
jgi:hypothetical protein